MGRESLFAQLWYQSFPSTREVPAWSERCELDGTARITRLAVGDGLAVVDLRLLEPTGVKQENPWQCSDSEALLPRLL